MSVQILSERHSHEIDAETKKIVQKIRKLCNVSFLANQRAAN